MVQILPPRTDAGSSIGAGLGQGLGQGIARGSEIGFQRNLVQQSLKGLENLPKDANAAQLASYLIQATAGIPGAERYVGQLFPLLLTQMQGQNPPEGAATARAGLPEQQGYLGSAPLTQQQKLQFAQEQRKFGVPLGEGIELANKLSEGSEQALTHIQSNLKAQGVNEKEMPYATQMAQLQTSNDPNQVIKNVRLGLDEFRQLKKISVPGGTRATVRALGGPIGNILAGTESREKALGRIHPVAQRLIEKGYDPIVREYLANLGLSPTEIQESIRPLSKEFTSKLSSLPPPSKNFSANQERLSDFMFKNVKPEDSLLVMRNKLWKDKNYDWRQINDAFAEAREKGLQLSAEQDRELAELSTPPRESLLDIFYDWGRIGDKILGRK